MGITTTRKRITQKFKQYILIIEIGKGANIKDILIKIEETEKTQNFLFN